MYIPTTSEEGRGSGGDFIAVDMVDRKIRLLWNNGGGASTKVITHNVTIEAATSRGNLLTDDHMWYKITAERVGNIGRLNVRKVKPVNQALFIILQYLSGLLTFGNLLFFHASTNATRCHKYSTLPSADFASARSFGVIS